MRVRERPAHSGASSAGQTEVDTPLALMCIRLEFFWTQATYIGAGPMMSKSDTISAIVQLNPTVNPVFLSEFSGEELDAYRSRLETVVPMTNADLAPPVRDAGHKDAVAVNTGPAARQRI